MTQAEQRKTETITSNWDELSDEQKASLIPVLLDSIQAWHGWSVNDASRLDWLERQFKLAGVPFRNGRR